MNEGWKCPVCGAGLAPFVSVCPNCTGRTVTITGPVIVDCGCPLNMAPCQNTWCPRRPNDGHITTVSICACTGKDRQACVDRPDCRPSYCRVTAETVTGGADGN